MSNEKWPTFVVSRRWLDAAGGGYTSWDVVLRGPADRLPVACAAYGLTEPEARAMARSLNLARESLALAEAAESLESLESFKLATPEWIATVAKRDDALAAFRAAREREGSKT
jgi:hypothetical protein